MNVTYTTVGSIQIPNLVLDPAPDATIGKYGRMRKRFLEQRQDGTLTALVLSGKLTEHLLEIDRTAREQIEALRDRTFPPAFAVIQLRLNELRLGFGRRLLRRRFRLSRFCRLLFRFGLLCGRRACTKQHRQHQQTCNPFFHKYPPSC